MYSVNELAQALGLSPSATRNRIKLACLLPQKVNGRGGRLLYADDALEKLRKQDDFAEIPVGWLTVYQVAESLGVTPNAIRKKAAVRHLEKMFVFSSAGAHTQVFSPDDVAALGKDMSTGAKGLKRMACKKNIKPKREAKQRNPQSIYYRVAVLDEDKNRWIVRHAGKTKKQAEDLVADYYDNGQIVRVSACI